MTFAPERTSAMMWQRWIEEQLEKLGTHVIADSEMRQAAEQLGLRWIEVDVNSTAAILRCGNDAAWFSHTTLTYRIAIQDKKATFVPYIEGKPHEGSWDQDAINQIANQILSLAGYLPVVVPLPIPNSAIDQS